MNLNNSTIKSLKPNSLPENSYSKTRISVEQMKEGIKINSGSNQKEPKSQASLRRMHGESASEAEKISSLKKIKKAADDYEAVFISEMVKAMRQTPLFETTGGDGFIDIAEEPFKAALVQAGGLGLSDKILAQVARQEGLEKTLLDNPQLAGGNFKMKISPSQRKKMIMNKSDFLEINNKDITKESLNFKNSQENLDKNQESYLEQIKQNVESKLFFNHLSFAEKLNNSL